MTLGELFGLEARLPAGLDRMPITGLAADSREVKPGYLFAALPGVKTDGARFIEDAIKRGAAAVLVVQGAKPATASAAIIEDSDPRRRLALIAARFFGLQPKTVVAVTGTNGKTSVASFVRQLWAAQGFAAASLGTVGVVSPSGAKPLKHTTPDPIELHGILAALAKDGVTHLALEASSHGLQQRRVDGVAFAAGAFTNISRDHLDYHASFEDYFAAEASSVHRASAARRRRGGRCRQRGRTARGAAGRSEWPQAHLGRTPRADAYGSSLPSSTASVRNWSSSMTAGITKFACRWSGTFQASNALVAAGLAMATGASAATVLPLLATLQGARGRLDLAGTARGGAPIFVDYAHTPDALAKALDALRPYVQHRLVVVFGCGGDRDKGKRPEMGKVAVAKADLAIVTDDNPRSEDPRAIRREILRAAPGAIEIGDRAAAIAEAIAKLEHGDVLLVAGKGHETGQTIGTYRHSVFRSRRGGQPR